MHRVKSVQIPPSTSDKMYESNLAEHGAQDENRTHDLRTTRSIKWGGPV